MAGISSQLKSQPRHHPRDRQTPSIATTMTDLRPAPGGPPPKETDKLYEDFVTGELVSKSERKSKVPITLAARN